MINKKILTFRCYRKKYNFKKIIKYISILIILILLLFLPNKVFADTEEEIMDSTQEEFNINGFIKEAQKYTGEFFEDIDLNNLLSEAIKGNVKNKRSHSLRATKTRQNLNTQIIRLADGTRKRISVKEKRTLLKNEKAA